MVLYLPAAQSTQRPPEEEYFPAAHNTQVAEDVDMVVAVDLPAGQDRQVAMEVAPAEALHLPALHGTQSPPAVE